MFFEKMDIYGKNFTFYNKSKQTNRTMIGGILTFLTYLLMIYLFSIIIVDFLMQERRIESKMVQMNKEDLSKKKFENNKDDKIKGKIYVKEKDLNNTKKELVLQNFTNYYKMFYNEDEDFFLLDLNLKNGSYPYLQFEIPIINVLDNINKGKQFEFTIIACAELLEIKDLIKNFEKFGECKRNSSEFENFYVKESRKIKDMLFSIYFEIPYYKFDSKEAVYSIETNFEILFQIRKDFFEENTILFSALNVKYDENLIDIINLHTNNNESFYLNLNGFQKTTYRDLEYDYFRLYFKIFDNSIDYIYVPFNEIKKDKLTNLLAKLGGLLKIISYIKLFFSSIEKYTRERIIIKNSLCSYLTIKYSKNNSTFEKKNFNFMNITQDKSIFLNNKQDITYSNGSKISDKLIISKDVSRNTTESLLEREKFCININNDKNSKFNYTSFLFDDYYEKELTSSIKNSKMSKISFFQWLIISDICLNSFCRCFRKKNERLKKKYEDLLRMFEVETYFKIITDIEIIKIILRNIEK